MPKSRKTALYVALILFVVAIGAAWLLGFRPGAANESEVPPGYVTLSEGDMRVWDTNLDPPDPGQACAVVAVNNSGKSVESVVLKFSTHKVLTLAGDTSGFGSNSGEFRATKPLLVGERRTYLSLAAPGRIESVALGWGATAEIHPIPNALVAGKSLVLSYEPDGKVSTRYE